MGTLVPPSSVLINTPEDVYVSETIVASGFTIIQEWDWAFTPIGNANPNVVPKNFTFDETATSLTINYYSNEDLFPLQYIEYVNPQVEVIRVNGFDDLPSTSESPDIVKMLTDGRNFQEWDLEVSVTGMSTEEGQVTISEVYRIMIRANYNGVRDQLVQEVNNRR